jgi:hypothetical protein
MLQDRPTYSLFKSKTRPLDNSSLSHLTKTHSAATLNTNDSKGCLLPIVFERPPIPEKIFKKIVDTPKCQPDLFALKFDSSEIKKIPGTKWYTRDKLFF